LGIFCIFTAAFHITFAFIRQECFEFGRSIYIINLRRGLYGGKIMQNYAAQDEILYHVGLSREMLKGAEYALLPGDPGRVEALAKALGPAQYLNTHREYTSWLAVVEGQNVLVCSTGMGGPSVAIGLEELARLGIKNFIRVGTTGCIQENINLGDVIINNAAVRLEGTSAHYAPLNFPAVASLKLTNALNDAAAALNVPHHVGISVSSDTFWPGQERYDSFTGYVCNALRGTLKEWQALGALNYEMETAALFVVAQAFGLNAASICGVIAKRTQSESIAPPEIYALASERFGAVTKKALQTLLKGE
jgi:uridine phosphorylase